MKLIKVVKFYTCFFLIVNEQKLVMCYSVLFKSFNTLPELFAHRSTCCNRIATDNSAVGARLSAESKTCEALSISWYERMEFEPGFEYYLKQVVMDRKRVSFTRSRNL